MFVHLCYNDFTRILYEASERFIAINDGVDTANGENEFAPFKNLLNEKDMNLFEIFVKLTHMHIRGCWEETSATFTGKTRKATEMRRRRIVEADYDAYEISYFADEKKIYSWHTFHPLPDPDPESLIGTKIRIRYKKTKPRDFEIIPQETYD